MDGAPENLPNECWEQGQAILGRSQPQPTAWPEDRHALLASVLTEDANLHRCSMESELPIVLHDFKFVSHPRSPDDCLMVQAHLACLPECFTWGCGQGGSLGGFFAVHQRDHSCS